MNWLPAPKRWLAFLATMLLLATLSRVGPLKTVVQPTHPWDGKASPGVYVEQGSYGLEISPDFYWIKDKVVRLRVENPTDTPLSATVRFAVGPTPCGIVPLVSIPTQTSTFLEAKQIKQWPVIAVGPKKSRSFDVKIRGEYCKIDSDPRSFLGSISDFEFNY